MTGHWSKEKYVSLRALTRKPACLQLLLSYLAAPAPFSGSDTKRDCHLNGKRIQGLETIGSHIRRINLAQAYSTVYIHMVRRRGNRYKLQGHLMAHRQSRGRSICIYGPDLRVPAIGEFGQIARLKPGETLSALFNVADHETRLPQPAVKTCGRSPGDSVSPDGWQEETGKNAAALWFSSASKLSAPPKGCVSLCVAVSATGCEASRTSFMAGVAKKTLVFVLPTSVFPV